MSDANVLDRDRLSVLTGGLILGLALGRLVEVPVRPFAMSVLGSLVGVNISAASLMALLMGSLGITAAESLVRSHPRNRGGRLPQTFMYWIVPGLLMLALAAWLQTAANLAQWMAGLAAAAVLAPLALAAEYAAVSREERGRSWLQWSQMALIYLVAGLLFVRIFDLRARSLLSATAVLLVAGLLAARLFWTTGLRPRLALLYGLVPGLAAGQMTWVLNYWRLSGLQGGLLLFMLFYVVTGLCQQYLSGRFGRQVVIEYVGVGLLALLGIALWAR
ncbi:MAG: DUF5656 family protein [Candidatus Promineifilaceae bacterium]